MKIFPQVKTDILREELVVNPEDYIMLAVDKCKVVKVMDEDASILDYFDEMSNGHFEFHLKK